MTISVTSHQKEEVVDITDQVSSLIQKEGLSTGFCLLFTLHTTCALTTADLDPGTDKDMLSFLRAIQPRLAYNHPHDPSHAPDHILSSIIGPSIMLPVENGKPKLGTWQRIILVELDGPRERTIAYGVYKHHD